MKRIAIVDVPAGSVRSLLDRLPAEVVLTGNSLPCRANSLRLIFDVTASDIRGGIHGLEQFEAQLPKPEPAQEIRAALATIELSDGLVALGLMGIKERDAQGWSGGEDETHINRELAQAVLKVAVPHIIERCAVAAEAQDKTGREWVRDSLWDIILRRAGANVRALL